MDLGSAFGIANVIVPSGGPKGVPVRPDFSNEAAIELDGEAIVTQGKIEYLQGVYIDNSLNGASISLTMNTTQQKITCPANAQGYFSIMVPNNPKILAETTQANGKIVPMIFYNVPIQPAVWSV